ncbi:MAG: VTT domain-containing protein [Bacteroidota bacterium]|nr:VTT domain-containing protein [Bacteroidota bacterium]
MEIIKEGLDILLHLNQHLEMWVANYGNWIYGILFLIIFVETGLVVMPLLPGDSLLFAAGALAASQGGINIAVLIPLLMVAALLGDNTNYFVGKYFGNLIKSKEKLLFLKRSHIEKTEAYYAKYGGKTVIIARFIPIVRTVAPFVAGAGSMTYKKYIINCVLGAILWVGGVTVLGYLAGNIPFVKNNFEVVIFGIIGISVLPIIIGYIQHKMKK